MSRRPFLVALAPALGYAPWAAFANRAAGTGPAVRAALVQAALSFAMTSVVGLAIESLFRRGRTPREGFWLASTGVGVAAPVVSGLAHVVAGTPRVIETIAPQLVVGTAFCFAYASRLRVVAERSAT